MDKPTLLGGRERSRGDAIGRHPYGWHCWVGEWLLLIITLEARLVHPSREARCQEAQVFQGGLCLSWLHKQASCLPASSTPSIPRETWPPVQGARGREAEGCRGPREGEGSFWALLFRCYQVLEGLWSLPWAQLRVIFTCFAPARYHLFPIDAEHGLVRVVTIAQKNHSANKYENARFHPLPLILSF